MQTRFFNIAKKHSKKSVYKFKLGCVLVKSGKIVSYGFNKNKTHTKSNNEYKKLHAELDSVLNTPHDISLKKCDAYVYRETKRGDLALAKPCTFCEKILRKVGVARVFFTTDGGFSCLDLII